LGAGPTVGERASRRGRRQDAWQMVERWGRDGETASPEARLELHSRRLPEQLLDEYSRASSELLNPMPFEDLDHGDIVTTAEQQREWYQRLDISGSSHDVCLVRDPDGTI